MSRYFKKRMKDEIRRTPTSYLFKSMVVRLVFVLVIFFIFKLIFDGLVYLEYNAVSDFEIREYSNTKTKEFIEDVKEGTKTIEDYEAKTKEELREEYLRNR